MDTTISFRTKNSFKKKLDKIAKMQERNRSFVINQAIDSYLAYNEEKERRIKLGERQIEEGKVFGEAVWQKSFQR